MNDPNELKEMIKEAVYEVIEPFIAQMARDHDETRQWMRSAEQWMRSAEQWMRSVEGRLAAIEQRLERLEQRLEHLEARVETLERRVTALEIEVRALRERMDLLEQRLAEHGFVESEAVARERWATAADLRKLELRVLQLEAAVFHQPPSSSEESLWRT
jgi:chromosome segregation ATPase